MCGIIGVLKKKKDHKEDLTRWVREQLEDQLDRGEEGFGIIKINKDRKVEVFRSTKLPMAMADLMFECRDAEGIILHHRWPTSTANFRDQTHPILVTNKELDHDYLIVHNGVISNTDKRKEAHKLLGYDYTTEMTYSSTYNTGYSYTKHNDSESIAIDLARLIDGETKEIESVGAAAILGVKIERKTGKAVALFFIRNDNPLMRAEDERTLRIASEGKGQEVTKNTLYVTNLETMQTTSKKLELNRYQASTVVPTTTKEAASGKVWDGKTQSWKDKDDIKEETKSVVESTIKGFEEKKEEEKDADYDDPRYILPSDYRYDACQPVEDLFDCIEDDDEIRLLDIDSEIEEITKKVAKGIRDAYELRIRQLVNNAYADEEKEREERFERIIGNA